MSRFYGWMTWFFRVENNLPLDENQGLKGILVVD